MQKIHTHMQTRIDRVLRTLIIDSPYPQIDLLYMYPPPYILLYTYGNTIDVFGDVAFWYLHTKTFDSLSKKNTQNICDTKNDTKKTFLVRNSRTA